MATVPNSAEIELWRARRKERLKDRPRLPSMTRDELRALLEGAGPATDDDVPWRFAVRTPLRRALDD